MNQTELLRFVVDALEDLAIRYVVAGSVASMAYGEARFTQDIDIVVLLRDSQVDDFCHCFPPEDFYVSVEAAHQAVATGGQFNILHAASGLKIDVMMAKDGAWGAAEMQRRFRARLLPDRDVNLASREDVIIGKMLYYREGGSEKHLRDITGMLRFGGALVDRAYVEKWARDLGVVDIWQAILTRYEAGI